MMNDFVPDFQTEEDDSIPTSSGFNHCDKPSMGDDELMELIWQNGQVVINNQNQKNLKKSHLRESALRNTQSSAPTATEEPPYQNLFMQEDEMVSWLHYPLEEDFTDLIYPSPSSTKATQLQQPDPFPSSRVPPISPESSKLHHFMRCSRPNARDEPQPSVSDKAVKESTMVESSNTPTMRFSQDESRRTGEHDREMGTTYDLTMTSSSGGSGGSADPIPSPKPTKDDRKRKAREDEEQEDEDAKFEAVDTKKQGRGSSSARRSRAAEVHNLSERRRRDRINEKMKALQELIPRCNKSDKASMLDEAIEYLKSLQLQVQMMSMGCSMVPMMYPGVQPYMAPMGMGMGMGIGMGMGMGMGMDMGLNRPMMPYPQVLAAPSMPRPAAAAQMGPRLPLPAYQLPPGSSPDASAMHPNQIDPSLNSIGIRSPNPAQVSYADSYHRYHNHYSMQAPPRAPDQVLNTAQASTSKGVERLENQKPG